MLIREFSRELFLNQNWQDNVPSQDNRKQQSKKLLKLLGFGKKCQRIQVKHCKTNFRLFLQFFGQNHFLKITKMRNTGSLDWVLSFNKQVVSFPHFHHKNVRIEKCCPRFQDFQCCKNTNILCMKEMEKLQQIQLWYTKRNKTKQTAVNFPKLII